MKRTWLVISILIFVNLMSACRSNTQLVEEEWTLVKEDIMIFSDDVSVSLWKSNRLWGDIYKLSDGTILLTVQEISGPSDVYVGGGESYDNLSESTQQAISKFFDDQGSLYDVKNELEKAYSDYKYCKTNGKEFYGFNISQDIAPVASNDHIICFITTVMLPIEGQVVEGIRMGAVFDKESGEKISNWDLFTLEETESKETFIKLSGVEGPDLRLEMEEALKSENIIFFQEHLEISFPLGSLPSQEHSYTLSIDYKDIQDIIKDWANFTLVKNEHQPGSIMFAETKYEYAITANGDLQIEIGKQSIILAIDALPDSHIIEDEYQRLLILSGPSNQYQHGILGDELEATSVTIVDLSDQPTVVSDFSIPMDWVIESIRPVWSDWDEDGEREILLTLSNSSEGAKLSLYDEKGNVLAESIPIGKGNRWRHALDIASFGVGGERLLVDVQTPHIGGIVSFYSWDKESKALEIEASLPNYSTHDIGSRAMHMYAIQIDEQNDQALLILPSQSKKELTALRLVSGAIHEEWRIPLGGRLSGNMELIEEDGMQFIRAIVDNNREVVLELPE